MPITFTADDALVNGHSPDTTIANRQLYAVNDSGVVVLALLRQLFPEADQELADTPRMHDALSRLDLALDRFITTYIDEQHVQPPIQRYRLTVTLAIDAPSAPAAVLLAEQLVTQQLQAPAPEDSELINAEVSPKVVELTEAGREVLHTVTEVPRN